MNKLVGTVDHALRLAEGLLDRSKEGDRIAFEDLNELDVEMLQKLLAAIGYNPGPIDGVIGPHTRSAYTQFVADHFAAGLDAAVLAEMVGEVKKRIADTVYELTFLDGDASLPEIKLDTRDDVLLGIMEMSKQLGLGFSAQWAYIAATTHWETASTFKPVKEAFWLSETWRRKNLRYYPYYGRGYVQLTWKDNYRKYENLTGAQLVDNPDLMITDRVLSLYVMCHGFKHGMFTGHKLEQYVTATKADFVGARKCVNGTDSAERIAALARDYLNDYERMTRPI